MESEFNRIIHNTRREYDIGSAMIYINQISWGFFNSVGIVQKYTSYCMTNLGAR